MGGPDGEHAVFISYASADRLAAETVRVGLEAKGLRCWIAERDASGEYAGQIASAIRSASAFVVVLSSTSNQSGHVRNEVAIAGDARIGMVPVRIEEVEAAPALDFYLRRWHWIDGTGGLSRCLERIATDVRALVEPGPRRDDAALPATARWAWWSGGRPASEGVISGLALVETALATALYAFVAWRWGTAHLTVAACVAPLLLLRSDDSIARGRALLLAMVDAIEGAFYKPPSRRRRRRGIGRLLVAAAEILTLMVLTVLGALILPFVAKVVGTLLALVRSPLQTLSGVPRNWWRFVASVDSRQSPELIPGFSPEAKSGHGTSIGDYIHPFGWLREIVSDDSGGRTSVAARLLTLLVFIVVPPFPVVAATMALCGLFALAYRWSIKGTALIWSPLVWIVRDSFESQLSARLRNVQTLAVHRAARIWSLLVLGALGLKLLMFGPLGAVGSRIEASVNADFLANVVVPHALPPWQVAAALNALLAWALYFVADWALHSIGSGRLANERALDVGFRVTWLVRGALSLYTIACSIYLAAFLSNRWALPPLGTGIMPW